MSAIDTSWREISNIIGVIDEIALQMNLLCQRGQFPKATRYNTLARRRHCRARRPDHRLTVIEGTLGMERLYGPECLRGIEG